MTPIRTPVLVLTLALAACNTPERTLQPARQTMPDLSGLAWVEGGTFLAVHDAKMTGEAGLPRVGFVELPRSDTPLRWSPLAVDWPDGSPSHDLESVARVPGTDTYLLAESGNHGSPFRRIFVADLTGGPTGEALRVREAAAWPVPVHDVEGTAVARIGGDLYFLFAERADGESGTEIAWATLTLDPLALGEVRRVPFQSPEPSGPGVRHISALEVDEQGRVYAASAYDPDHDGGPFRSAVWYVGALVPEAAGHVRLDPTGGPRHVATLDGMKVESLAFRSSSTGAAELIVGTDDEDYGGAIRPLPGQAGDADALGYRSPIPGLTERTLPAWSGERVR